MTRTTKRRRPASVEPPASAVSVPATAAPDRYAPAPTPAELDEILRKAMPAAVAALVAIASNDRAAPSPRTTAAIALLRAAGVLAPITVRVGNDAERLSPAEMAAVIDVARTLEERRRRVVDRAVVIDLFD